MLRDGVFANVYATSKMSAIQGIEAWPQLTKHDLWGFYASWKFFQCNLYLASWCQRTFDTQR